MDKETGLNYSATGAKVRVSAGFYRSPNFPQSWWGWSQTLRRFLDLKLGWEGEPSEENEGGGNAYSDLEMSTKAKFRR